MDSRNTSYSFDNFIEAAVADFLINGFVASSAGDLSSKNIVRDRLDLEVTINETETHKKMVHFIKYDMLDIVKKNKNTFINGLSVCLEKTRINYKQFGMAVCIPRTAKTLIDKIEFSKKFPDTEKPYPILTESETKNKTLSISGNTNSGIFIGHPKATPISYQFTDIVAIESMYRSSSLNEFTKTIFRFRTIHGQRLIWYSSTPIEKFAELKTHVNGSKKLYLIKGSVVRAKQDTTQINRVRINDWSTDEPTDELLEENEMVKILRAEPFYILKIKDPSEKMLETAIRKEPFVVKHLPALSEDLQKLAFSKNPITVAFLKKPNGKLQAKVLALYPCLSDQLEELHPGIGLMEL